MSGSSEKVAAVHIAAGLLLLQDCDVTADAGCAVLVTGTAAPRIAGNRVKTASTWGLELTGESKPICVKNTVRGGESGGVLCAEKCAATLEKNTLKENGGPGCLVKDSAAPRVQENEVTNNLGAGLEAAGASAPVLLRNRIWGGQAQGLWLHDSSKAAGEGNVIFANKGDQVCVEAGKTEGSLSSRILYVSQIKEWK